MATEKTTQSVPEELLDAQSVETTNLTSTAEKPALEKKARKVSKPKREIVEESQEEPAKDEELTQIDFSDEEAEIAADSPEFDLGDNIESEQDHENESVGNVVAANYAGVSKQELIQTFDDLLQNKPVQTIRAQVEAIKVSFYKLHRAEVEQLRKLFVESGGNIEEFVAPDDDAERKFKELFVEYRKKRDEYINKIESEKEDNYKVKLSIIEELKELINSNETMNHTFNAFRELQHRWKETGLVPQTHIKDLWETYNLHVENFYNVIKINKELRDLDLKKNYEAKIALCEEAEALILENSVINAFHKLQKLHTQWRETGPVANEYKEQLWDRFREASSKINKNHQDYFENIKDEQKRNLDLKAELCVKTEELCLAPVSSRKEWSKASEQLIEIQKVWKTIGFAPKKDNAKIYERFRAACDKFFENKRNFYLNIKNEMDLNLQLKNEICAMAESLRDSEDWKKATDELIALQKKWKEVGAVSRRHSDVVWKRFRAACDKFFERKSAHFSQVDSVYEQNLTRKQEMIKELGEMVAGARESSFDAIKELQRRWSEAGFVPIKYKDSLQNEYRKSVDAIFAKLRGNDRERKIEKFKGKVSAMKEGDSDRKLRNERERLYNKYKQLEADVALLENNIGFFSKSKNAESMIKDVKTKIQRAKEDMAVLLEKINTIDKQGE